MNKRGKKSDLSVVVYIPGGPKYNHHDEIQLIYFVFLRIPIGGGGIPIPIGIPRPVGVI